MKKVRSAVTGKYVAKAAAKKSPATTVTETVKTFPAPSAATILIKQGTSEIERARIAAWLRLQASYILNHKLPNGLIRKYFPARGKK